MNRVDRWLLALQYDVAPRLRPAAAVFGWAMFFGVLVLAVCLAGVCIERMVGQ